MAARMVRTATPGIYKRGSRYVVVYKVDGRQRKESARTLMEARAIKRARETARDRGEVVEQTRELLREYSRRWIDTYTGKGRGFRERTRQDYRRDLERYVIPFLGSKRLTAIRRSDVREWIAWLTDDKAQAERHERENAERKSEAARIRAVNAEGAAQGLPQLPVPQLLRHPGPLKDATVHRIVSVASACFRSAMLDDLRADNPVSGAVLPRRDALPTSSAEDEGDGQVKALSRAELAVILRTVRPEWRTLFALLAGTGLRVSEAIALEVDDVRLDGSRAHVRVRRGIVNGHIDRPKSDHGARLVPLDFALVRDLRRHIAGLPEQPADALRKWGRLVFPSEAGTAIDPGNVRERVLRPAREEAGAAWAGFHAFRHFFASAHIDRGTNIVRLSRLMGHSKPSTTLDIYGHLMDDGLGDPLDVGAELAAVATSESQPAMVM